ncbi:MAG: hypothetical protein GY856_17050 [bacterium]|nr:hypothetical protein [bacterium]
MDLEQSIDGMVGRMIHWVNAAFLDDRESVKPIRANKKKSEAVTESEPAAKKTAAKKAEKPAAKKPAVKEPVAAATPEPVVEPQPPADSAEALEALDAAGGSASLSELVGQTGSTRYALRRQLNGMIASGEAKRVGAGLKTRYELLKASSRGKPRRKSPRTRAEKS